MVPQQLFQGSVARLNMPGGALPLVDGVPVTLRLKHNATCLTVYPAGVTPTVCDNSVTLDVTTPCAAALGLSTLTITQGDLVLDITVNVQP